MFKEVYLEGEIKDEEIVNNNYNNINNRYFNIDNNPSSKNKNNSLKNNFSLNSDDNDEDLDIELESISQKIPLENFGINNKDERYIKLENNNKISPLQRKKRSKIHRHKSYDNWHNHNNAKDNQNNSIINYTKINSQKRNTINIKITNDNMRKDFNEQNENPNNKTEYELYRENKNKKFENDSDKNTIDVKIKNISYFKNFNDKAEFEPIEIIDTINNNSLKNNVNSNLINLKAAHNNNYFINLGKNEIQNLINKNDELNKNFNDLFNKINIEDNNCQNNDNKYNDDESLVKKIENKLKNKFDDENNLDEYFNRTPIIKNNYINYFDNSFGGIDSDNKKGSSNVNEILFKPTNIIIEKNQTEKPNDYSNEKIQHIYQINQSK